jgi:hypothetical protein
MILTEEYFEARSEAMKWLGLKQDKRNFAAGLKILVKSGYKPNVQKLLVRKGELPWTMEKLTSCLRDVVQVYYNPDDPRFDDVPDADILNDKTGEKPTVDEQDGIARLSGSADFQNMPEVMQTLIRNYSDAYKQRARLARQRYELGESNDEQSVEKRKTLGESIDRLTNYMDILIAMREKYEKDGVLPDMDTLNNAPSAAEVKEEDGKPEESVDYKSMSTDKLKTRRKSLTNQITRKENMLLYQSESKQEEENPLPDSPKRVKLEKQIENLKAEKSKVEYELAERS